MTENMVSSTLLSQPGPKGNYFQDILRDAALYRLTAFGSLKCTSHRIFNSWIIPVMANNRDNTLSQTNTILLTFELRGFDSCPILNPLNVREKSKYVKDNTTKSAKSWAWKYRKSCRINPLKFWHITLNTDLHGIWRKNCPFCDVALLNFLKFSNHQPGTFM